MDIETVYNQLTNVDIEQQKLIWDERGKGYYGEYLLFCELYKNIIGCGKFLMNLNIPTANGKTTEVDLILIHETGLYVFEIKHYKGTIYGKDTDPIWTQYFRTAKNNTFKNPIIQNKYHIEALKRIFPHIPIYSCIVFTNDNCDIRVNNSSENIDVCHLENVGQNLTYRFGKSENILSMQDIDNIFEKLSGFSQMKEPVTIDETTADFFAWIQPTIAKLEEKKDEVENEKNVLIFQTNELKKTRNRGITFNIVIAVVTIVLVVFVYFNEIQKNNNELAEFKQNFLHIDEIDNVYIQALDSYVDVSNVSLSLVADNVVSFTARIAMLNDVYGVAITQNSKYIVMTTSGKVIEYNVFGEHLSYYRNSNVIGKGIRDYGDLARSQFFGISSVNDILYIKITEIELFKLDIRRTVIKDKLEIELFSKY